MSRFFSFHFSGADDSRKLNKRWVVHHVMQPAWERAFRRGDRVHEWETLDVHESADPKVDRGQDVPWSTWLIAPIVSDKVKQICEQDCGAFAQYLPVRILLHGVVQEQFGKYWIMNILQCLDCVNRTASSYEILEEFKKIIFEMNGPVYDSRAIEGTNLSLFRVKYSPSYILISDGLRRSLEIANVSGCYFRSIRTAAEGFLVNDPFKDLTN